MNNMSRYSNIILLDDIYNLATNTMNTMNNNTNNTNNTNTNTNNLQDLLLFENVPNE
jgi:hypothetical protein